MFILGRISLATQQQDHRSIPINERAKLEQEEDGHQMPVDLPEQLLLALGIDDDLSIELVVCGQLVQFLDEFHLADIGRFFRHRGRPPPLLALVEGLLCQYRQEFERSQLC
jgi:hypothetical protein